MKNFNTWAAAFFSWGETPSEAEIEGYELAYNAGREHLKQEILKMIDDADCPDRKHFTDYLRNGIGKL